MGGVFSPLPKLKKKCSSNWSICLLVCFPFSRFGFFVVFFLCFEEFLWKHRSLSKPTKLSFLKKGRSIGVKFSNKIWVHSVGGQHRNTLGWRLGGFFQEDFHHWSSPKTHFEPGKWKKNAEEKVVFVVFLLISSYFFGYLCEISAMAIQKPTCNTCLNQKGTLPAEPT